MRAILNAYLGVNIKDINDLIVSHKALEQTGAKTSYIALVRQGLMDFSWLQSQADRKYDLRVHHLTYDSIEEAQERAIRQGLLKPAQYEITAAYDAVKAGAEAALEVADEVYVYHASKDALVPRKIIQVVHGIVSSVVTPVPPEVEAIYSNLFGYPA